MLVCLLSCNSRNFYRQRIEKLDEGEDKYLVAAAIGEYFHLFPEDITQLPRYADMLMQNGYFAECIDLCNNILQYDKKNWQVYYTRALAFSNIWEFNKSLRDLNTIFTLVKPGAEIAEQYQLTILYNSIYQKILTLDSLIAENPGNSGFYLQRANLYLNMNEPLPAITDYEYCLNLAGFNPDIVYNKLRAEILLKNFDQARKDIERIRSETLSNGLPDPDLLLKMTDDAETYEEMIRQDPDNITGYVEMARIFTFLKIENKAIEYLKSAQKIRPDNNQIKYNMALVYAMGGKTEQARQLVIELEGSGVKIPDQLKKMIE